MISCWVSRCSCESRVSAREENAQSHPSSLVDARLRAFVASRDGLGIELVGLHV
jgi:hypothetical protein